MDVVLGLSMTSLAVRWVLVEGTTGEGATVDRGSIPADTEEFDADALIGALLGKAGAEEFHAIGLTWTGAAEATASAVWHALTDRCVENVISVSDLEAAEALTCGIAGIAGYERVAVCVVEPGAAVVAAVTPEGVTADRVDPADLGDVDGWAPEAVFAVGSGDVEGLVAVLEGSTQVPVISADEADMALARGSALASADAVSLLETPTLPKQRQPSPPKKLVSVLAAAVVTFVVSLSVALVPHSEAPRTEHPGASVPEAADTPESPAKAAPPATKSPTPRTSQAPTTAEPVAVAVPVPDAGLIVVQPATPAVALPESEEPLTPAPAVLAPPPGFVPPLPPPNDLPPDPAPAYVPPVQPPTAAVSQQQQQQPRLRDRIIDRIPVINRFNEPDPYVQ
ncbi:MAG: hypothetical protein K0U84_04545 [Actinomycetia bacterium]|nr:hypothetical protein [Actinomycetes bacterium]